MASDSGLPYYPAFMGGLSDPSTTQYKHRRAVFNLVNKLHSYGLEHQLDLPQIAVVGSQSVGKSSLIESIAGIKLPRAQGTCTRCPIECHLSRSNSPWSCKIYLRLANQVETPFGHHITDSEEVEERIRRAQLAILNPSKRASDFLGTLGSTDAGLKNELSFSSDLISVRISGVEVDDLSFVDLPGVISSVKEGGREADIEEVTDLVLKVIEKPSCLILLVISGETDLENQAGRRLVKQVDAMGSRTISVLTKPDRIPVGEHDSWLHLLQNEQGHFQHGWYCVKQSDQQQLDDGISWQDARDNEVNFFANIDPWRRVPSSLKSRLGTQCLTSALGKKLFDLICKRLPDLFVEVEKRVQSLKSDIKRLPINATEDPLRTILKMTNAFKKDVEQLVKGRPGDGKPGLVQTFRRSKEDFGKAIFRQAPEFKPFDRPLDAPDGFQTPRINWGNELDEPGTSLYATGVSAPLDFTREMFEEEEEEEEPTDGEDPRTFVYLDEVLEVAKYALTRELPYNYPYAVKEYYVARFTKRWPLPAKKLFQKVESHFSKELDALVVKHFSRFGPGELDEAVQRTVQSQLKSCRSRTIQKIKECIMLEHEEPATVDEESLALHKSEFGKKYIAARQTHIQKMSAALQSFIVGGYDHSPMPLVFQYLQQMGIGNVKKDDLLRLLPVATGDAIAIDIMSEVRAYYQVAFKRFVDYIPMIIDFELLKGFNHTLDDALYQGLGLGQGNDRDRCASFLREDPEVVRYRNLLHHDLERFEAALSGLRGIAKMGFQATLGIVDPLEPAEGSEQPLATPLRRRDSMEEFAIPAGSPSSISGEMVPPASSFALGGPPPVGGGKKKKGKNKAKQ